MGAINRRRSTLANNNSVPVCILNINHTLGAKVMSQRWKPCCDFQCRSSPDNTPALFVLHLCSSTKVELIHFHLNECMSRQAVEFCSPFYTLSINQWSDRSVFNLVASLTIKSVCSCFKDSQSLTADKQQW